MAATHEAGGRVAVHSTMPGAAQLVAAGEYSDEHGFGQDELADRSMADRGTARTPTVAALLALLDAPSMTPEPRLRLQEDIVTYDPDPRQDPDQLAHPAAVVAGGVRLR